MTCLQVVSNIVTIVSKALPLTLPKVNCLQWRVCPFWKLFGHTCDCSNWRVMSGTWSVGLPRARLDSFWVFHGSQIHGSWSHSLGSAWFCVCSFWAQRYIGIVIVSPKSDSWFLSAYKLFKELVVGVHVLPKVEVVY